MPNPANRRPTLRAAAACSMPAIAVALVALLPFLDKAFTIDDMTFLFQAKHILEDPLHPTAFNMVFDGVAIRLSRQLVTGPVMAYLLTPSVLLGGAEWAAHVLELAFLVLGALATAALALQLGLDRTQAAIASLLVVVSPAVLGMAATAMPDVPAMAFTVAGMERLLVWRRTRHWNAGLTTALLLAMAALSRPHVLLAFPCATLWLVDRSDWRPPWSRVPSALVKMAPVALALAIFGVVVFVTRDPASGDTITSATLGRVNALKVVFNLASFTLHWALTFPLVILWPLLRGGRFVSSRRNAVALVLGIILAASAGFFSRPEWWWSIPVVLVGLGVAVLADILGDAWQRRDQTQLVLGTWLLIAAAAAVYIQLPPKLLVPSAPAMALLIARELDRPGRGRARCFLVGAAATASLVLAILVIRADNALAEIGRIGGRVVEEQVKRGSHVWMDGAWGFQWYAVAAGARPVAETPPFPRAGDVVVASLQARLAAAYPNRTLLSRRVFAQPGGRIHGEGAGFFTNWAGPWPWVWGRKEIGRIEVWRIDAPADDAK